MEWLLDENRVWMLNYANLKLGGFLGTIPTIKVWEDEWFCKERCFLVP